MHHCLVAYTNFLQVIKKVYIIAPDKNTNLQSNMQEQKLSQNVCQFITEE